MKKSRKILICCLFASVLILIIYFITLDKKVYYLSVGDPLISTDTKRSYNDYVRDYLEDKAILKLYVDKYSERNCRIIDILNAIKNNKQVLVNDNKVTFKNALVKADIITLSVGMGDLYYKLKFADEDFDYDDLYKYIDEVFADMEKLFVMLRKITSEDIYIIGFYNPFVNYSNSLSYEIEPLILYANSKLENTALKYKINVIKISDKLKSNDKALASYYELYPTDVGHKLIAERIIEELNKKILAK